jgi:hypothetical protein
MLSESKVFRCHELPDWQRWFWLLWAMLPGIVAGPATIRRRLAVNLIYNFETMRLDWRAGWQAIFDYSVPVGIATG